MNHITLLLSGIAVAVSLWTALMLLGAIVCPRHKGPLSANAALHRQRSAFQAPSFIHLRMRTQISIMIACLLVLPSVRLPGQAVGSVMAGSGQHLPSAQLQAKPGPVEIDFAKSAVIVVDMQNDCCSEGGMFDLLEIDMSGIQKVVAPIARVLVAARKTGAKIVYLRTADVGVVLPGRDGRNQPVLVRDSWGTEIVAELRPEPSDNLVYKHRFSGFFETELDAVLKKLGVTQLIFTGCTTSVCVESTLRDAFFRDYSCVLLGDCTAEPCGVEFPRSNHEATLYLVEKRFGAVSNSVEFLKTVETALAAPKRAEN